jgi:ABC-type transport system involved in multi-copper enzyme maturation permease subunit
MSSVGTQSRHSPKSIEQTNPPSQRTTMSTVTAPSEAVPMSHSAIHPQRLFTLLTVEFRKLVDTRSGKAVLAIGLAVPLAALVYLLVKGGDDMSWRHFSDFTPVLGLTIPLIGLFAMTAEWTQRTALTTFTLSPRRGRVLAMKFVASFGLAMAVLAVVIGLTLAATALGGLITGIAPSYAFVGADVSSLAIITALQVIMAAGFGALAAQTAVAVGAFLVAPTLWAVVGPLVFGANGQWLDVFAAYGRLSSSTPFADLPQTLTAIAIWVVLPTTVGVVRSLRREVK